MATVNGMVSEGQPEIKLGCSLICTLLYIENLELKIKKT